MLRRYDRWRGRVVTGQGVIGRNCAWCGVPAVGEVQVQPARYRTVSRRDPVTGKRTSHQAFVRAAIVVPVCDEHQHITTGQPGPVPVSRQRAAKGVEQLGMFPSTADERLRNAIYRETGR
jgi:hypothetical protein